MNSFCASCSNELRGPNPDDVRQAYKVDGIKGDVCATCYGTWEVQRLADERKKAFDRWCTAATTNSQAIRAWQRVLTADAEYHDALRRFGV